MSARYVDKECVVKVFLSWSGQKSHDVAQAMGSWLPTVLFGAKPWISSSDIDKGSTWITSIKDALHESNGLGIFFLTREALSSNWLMFEAGSIASLGHQRVCVVYVDVDASEVGAPLSLFQGTKLTKEDIHALLKSLNKSMAPPMEDAVLATTFERGWADLANQLHSIETKVDKSARRAKKPSTEQLLVDLSQSTQRIEARLSNLERRSSRYNADLRQMVGHDFPHFLDTVKPRSIEASYTHAIHARRTDLFRKFEPLQFREYLSTLTPTQRGELLDTLAFESLESLNRSHETYHLVRRRLNPDSDSSQASDSDV